jgi:hypothetical protein
MFADVVHCGLHPLQVVSEGPDSSVARHAQKLPYALSAGSWTRAAGVVVVYRKTSRFRINGAADSTQPPLAAQHLSVLVQGDVVLIPVVPIPHRVRVFSVPVGGALQCALSVL